MDLDQLWQLTLAEMEVQLSQANFATWLKSSRLIDTKGGTFTIALPNAFAKEWVENKYHKNILGILRNFDSSARKLEFLVQSTTQLAPQPKAQIVVSEQSMPFDFSINPETNLNPRYTLKTFVVGSSNEMAFAAANAIIENVSTKYNPFFIYGGVGLGKTHLIQAIGNEIYTRYHGKVRPRYVTSDRFTSDVVSGIRNKRFDDVKRKYRDCDVLIIDDIQFIGGKEKTEEEFFQMFNALYQNNKQIIISSDRPPQSIPILEDRLRSRFEAGLTTDIGYPEYEMRLAIIREKLEEKQHTLADGLIDLVARRVKKNIREIEGVLNKIIFHEQTKKTKLSEKDIESIINQATRNYSDNISDEQILSAVADFFHIAVSDLTGRGRKKEIVEPRQIAMYLMRDLLDMSYPYIGEKLGRDHTTAIHAVGKVEEELNRNTGLNQKINNIKELLTK